MRTMMYDERLITPMREELTRLGITEMRTPEDVDSTLRDTPGTTLVVVNSICGCAARNARPAVERALRHAKRPDRLTTVFAGQDAEATARARAYFAPYPASSPQIALLKDGAVAFMLERRNIEGRVADEIAKDLVEAFERHC